jgi:hypothetical protein
LCEKVESARTYKGGGGKRRERITDVWRGLGRQKQSEFVEQQGDFVVGVAVAGEEQFRAGGDGEVIVEHLHLTEFFEDGGRRWTSVRWGGGARRR